MKMDVLNWQGKKVSDISVKEIFFTEELNKALLQKLVVWQLACKRQGDHKVKTRAEVSGGGKKPFRQKGTGSARQGSIRSPLLKGGGVIHGPQLKSYAYTIPKKIKQKALKQAMSYLFQQKKLFFIENMTSDKGKTKDMHARFKTMGWNQALLIDNKHQDQFKRACNNLKKFKCLQVQALNVYDILKYENMVLTPELLNTIYKKCGVA